jgi:hypothetical protein
MELGDAIDGRMALLRLKSRFDELYDVSDPGTFEQAMRAAVQEIRVSEQAAAFYLKFSFEHIDKTARLTTPLTFDEETALSQRRELQSTSDSVSLHAKMLEHSKEARKALTAQRESNLKALLREVEFHRLRASGPAAPREVLLNASFKIIGNNKVGILETPDVKARVVGHLRPEAVFLVSEVKPRINRKFLRLADGRGWVAECSRKDAQKVVAEELRAARLMIKDKDVPVDEDSDGVMGSGSDGNASSSSSSSPSSDSEGDE